MFSRFTAIYTILHFCQLWLIFVDFIEFYCFLWFSLGIISAIKNSSNPTKIDRIRWKSWPIEIDRSQIVQNSPIKMSVFGRFFENATNTSEMAIFCIFLAVFWAADENHWIFVKLPNFIKFLVVLPMSTIVSAQIAHFRFL